MGSAQTNCAWVMMKSQLMQGILQKHFLQYVFADKRAKSEESPNHNGIMISLPIL